MHTTNFKINKLAVVKKKYKNVHVSLNLNHLVLVHM